jgi:hypothetical protein
MKISDRVDKLESTLITHLEESGEIRSDLKWLKKAFGVLVGLGVTTCGTAVGAWLRNH